jgi:metacaspase-1
MTMLTTLWKRLAEVFHPSELWNMGPKTHKGISIHVGLNRVDPAQYGGWAGQLQAAVQDMNDMADLAVRQGFKAWNVANEVATAEEIIRLLGLASRDLGPGDTLVFTFAGHGGEVPDLNGDEEDQRRKRDQTLVCYNRQLIDDELRACWGLFRPGVRILMLADSCHSGTVARVLGPMLEARAEIVAMTRPRACPEAVCRANFDAHLSAYRAIKDAAAAATLDVLASVVLISACQDDQSAMDGLQNGAFTGNVLRVWNGGRFQGDMHQFRDAVAIRLGPSQVPNYYRVGVQNLAFERGRPFSIG